MVKTKTVRKGKTPARGSSQRKVPVEKTSAGSVAGEAQTAARTPEKPQTDEERKATKNAYVRAWRAAHKDEYAAYMKQWREKRQGKAPAPKKTATKARTSAKKSAAKQTSDTPVAVASTPTQELTA